MEVVEISREERDVYLIPQNFVDTGTILGGTVKLRNAVEAAVLAVGSAVPLFYLPLAFNIRLMIVIAVSVPLAVFGVVGFGGDSLTQFVAHWFRFMKRRRIVTPTQQGNLEANRHRHLRLISKRYKMEDDSKPVLPFGKLSVTKHDAMGDTSNKTAPQYGTEDANTLQAAMSREITLGDAVLTGRDDKTNINAGFYYTELRLAKVWQNIPDAKKAAKAKVDFTLAATQGKEKLEEAVYTLSNTAVSKPAKADENAENLALFGTFVGDKVDVTGDSAERTVRWQTMQGLPLQAENAKGPITYLRRDEKGTEDYHGCIYADYVCRMDSGVKVSRNLIFYGHTFTDEDYTGGFEDLHNYRVFEFGQENPYIYVSLADEKLTYQIFSVWVCDAKTDTDCIQADPDDAAFQQILDKAVAGCAFDYGVDVTTDDHILTLSTCTADPNSRLLVVAKLIDGGGVNVAS